MIIFLSFDYPFSLSWLLSETSTKKYVMIGVITSFLQTLLGKYFGVKIRERASYTNK